MPEHVFFNGHRYNRYPESSNVAHQKYFSRGAGKGFLHRDVWEYHNGPIPEGYHVHHIDGDPANNEISNLACLSPEEHRLCHASELKERSLSEKNLQHLAEIREKAKDWHQSEEGLAWHKQVSGQYLVVAREKLAEKRREEAKNPKMVSCIECGQMFPSPSGRAKVCSNACHSRISRRRRRGNASASEMEN